MWREPRFPNGSACRFLLARPPGWASESVPADAPPASLDVSKFYVGNEAKMPQVVAIKLQL